MGSLNDSNKTSDSDRSEVVLTDETSGIRAEVKTFAGEDRLLVSGSGDGSIGDLFIENAENGGSADLRVDGSTTPVVFTIPADSTDTIRINELRFYAGGNGIKFNQFLSQNTSLGTGLEVKIKSQDIVVTFPMIFTTEDFKNKWSFGSGSNFVLQKQTGADQILAVNIFPTPIVIDPQGTHGTDDYIQVTISDDLTTGGIAEFELLAEGFKV
jgi:hypothetical protein